MLRRIATSQVAGSMNDYHDSDQDVKVESGLCG